MMFYSLKYEENKSSQKGRAEKKKTTKCARLVRLKIPIPSKTPYTK